MKDKQGGTSFSGKLEEIITSVRDTRAA